MTQPLVGILILNHNGRRWLEPLLASIRANAYPAARLFLVDNASTDGSVELARARHRDVEILSMPGNLGYCAAYNLATPRAFEAGCEWAVWSNNDVLLEAGCLRELVAAARSDPRVGAAGPAFLEWEGNEPNRYMREKHPYAIEAMLSGSAAPIEVDWVEGSFLMLNRRAFERVGGLDSWFGSYWEEADFCRRLRRAGLRVVLAPRAVARHFGGGTSKSAAFSAERQWLLARNQLMFKMTDPGGSFSGNLARTLHVLLVELKKSLDSGPRTRRLRLRAFSTAIALTPQAHRKWQRDRQLNSRGAGAL
jgi:GT2 family glycosyltransferase